LTPRDAGVIIQPTHSAQSNQDHFKREYLMWKKIENFANSRFEPSSNETPEQPAGGMDAMLEDAIEGNGAQEDEFTAGSTTSVAAPQAELPKPPSAQQESGATLGAYTEAVKKFTKSASAFIEHVPLLAEAREAYEEATRASTELRRVLDSGDENLRALMTQLEQMANVNLGSVPILRSISDKKKPEASQLGPIRGSDEGKSGIKRFP
jgi:hypothetical protein